MKKNKIIRDFADLKGYEWSIGRCRSDNFVIELYSVHGVKADVQQFIYELIEANKKEDADNYAYGANDFESTTQTINARVEYRVYNIVYSTKVKKNY